MSLDYCSLTLQDDADTTPKVSTVFNHTVSSFSRTVAALSVLLRLTAPPRTWHAWRPTPLGRRRAVDAHVGRRRQQGRAAPSS